MNAFAWGATGCGGLRVGIRTGVDSLSADRTVDYEVALENVGAKDRLLTLYLDLDTGPRFVATIERVDDRSIGRGENVIPWTGTTSGASTRIHLAPGAIDVRAGKLPLSRELIGDAKMWITYAPSGTLEQGFIRSAEILFVVLPPAG